MSEKMVQASFTDDHDQLDELLDVYRRSKRVDFDRAKQAFKQFEVGLQQHILQEEGVLFPLFEEKTGMRDFGPTAVMRAEHREITRRLEAIHEKLRVGDAETEQEEEALVVILSAHNQKEENVLYPAIDRLLNSDERAVAFQKMEALPPPVYHECCGWESPRSAGRERYSPNPAVALR